MTEVNNKPGSKRWKLNRTDAPEIIKFFLISLVASVLTLLGDITHMIDFEQYQYFVTMVLIPALVAGQRWFKDYAKLDE